MSAEGMAAEGILTHHRGALRAGLIAGALTLCLVIIFGLNPHDARASPLQQHGALQRHGDIGIVSHRGAAAIAPENTLAATHIAARQGADFIEVDLQLTADREVVLMHDPDLARTTNGEGLVTERTLAEIRSLDAGSWFAKSFAGEPVPTLAEFIDAIEATPTSAMIELKGEWTRADVEAVIELLRTHGMMNRIVLESFETGTLVLLHELAPEFARMLLTRELDAHALEFALDVEVSAIGAREGLFDESPEVAAQIRNLGMGALVYTLNDEESWDRAVARGNDLIITDDPVGLYDWREAVGVLEPDDER
ncbi:glycerophosphodiester phosphodiesterase [Leucobacter sp. GX24907]